MLVIASKAVSLINGSKQSKMSIMKTNRIIVAGAYVFGLTLCRVALPGNALSLAIAKPILDVTVMLLNPAQNTFISKRIVIKMLPTL